ncbi:unnamed protein product [Onchocerca flexuosa]|uniref:Lipoyl-binding domain-containing protein n=1 Tax=Onchocerca flexuosa TaxID=387005 RepID=A0A183H5A5_9BILA|nr:unnamed protein product [Onchocerca flexuosa]
MSFYDFYYDAGTLLSVIPGIAIVTEVMLLIDSLSPSVSKTGGKIVKWHKKEQDKVEVGDIIIEIETDKAIMELEFIDRGVLAKILVSEGVSGVPVNQPIATEKEGRLECI